MMFFLFPRSRQTRRTIWSGVSVKAPALVTAQELTGGLRHGDLLSELEGVPVGDDDLGLAELALEVWGH